MHEGSIAQAILDSAVAELPAGAIRIEKIVVAIGSLCGVEGDCLRSFFGELARGTKAQGAELVVDPRPARLVCPDCGLAEEVRAGWVVEPACRRCGGPNRLEGGTEMYLESLEVEVEDQSGKVDPARQ